MPGTRLVAAMRSPPTASAKLRRSLVVVMTAIGSCAQAGYASSKLRAASSAAAPAPVRDTPGAAFSLALADPGALGPDALGHEAVHILFGIGDCTNPAIHRHAGEPIGVQSRDFLFGFEPLNHAHGCVVHGLVQIRVFGVRNVILGRLLDRPLHVLPVSDILGIEAVDALLD